MPSPIYPPAYTNALAHLHLHVPLIRRQGYSWNAVPTPHSHIHAHVHTDVYVHMHAYAHTHVRGVHVSAQSSPLQRPYLATVSYQSASLKSPTQWAQPSRRRQSQAWGNVRGSQAWGNVRRWQAWGNFGCAGRSVWHMQVPCPCQLRPRMLMRCSFVKTCPGELAASRIAVWRLAWAD